MPSPYSHIHLDLYDYLGWAISHYEVALESVEYKACQFKVKDLRIISRNAKITPRKTGQFVTCWKRLDNGPIEPLSSNDPFDFLLVNVFTADQKGQFIFPKSILHQKGILSTATKEGKRAFRTYPSWDIPTSKQAQTSQKWQLNHFHEWTTLPDLDRIRKLYGQLIG